MCLYKTAFYKYYKIYKTLLCISMPGLTLITALCVPLIVRLLWLWHVSLQSAFELILFSVVGLLCKCIKDKLYISQHLWFKILIQFKRLKSEELGHPKDCFVNIGMWVSWHIRGIKFIPLFQILVMEAPDITQQYFLLLFQFATDFLYVDEAMKTSRLNKKNYGQRS